MNFKTPLAAALLMAASAAQAGPAATTIGGFTPAANPFSLGAAAADDMIFKCSTPPYIACTTAQINQRELIRETRVCPAPASQACVNYLMTSVDADPVQFLGNQANPTTAAEEFFKKCDTIPYRPCTNAELAQKQAWEAEQKAAKEWEDSHQMIPPTKLDSNGNGYGIEGGLVGPPLPPGFYDKQDKEALAMARADIGKNGVKDVIDLGGGKLAMMMDDGTVGMCSRSQCDRPVPASQTKDPRIAAWVADNKMNDGSSGGGQPNTPVSLTNAGRTGNPADAPPSTPTDTAPPGAPPGATARSTGAEFAADQAAITGGRSGDASGGTAGAVAAGDNQPVIKVDGNKVLTENAKGFTYTKIADAEKKSIGIIKGGAATFNPAPQNGRPEDPPVDEKYLGKIQAAANQ